MSGPEHTDPAPGEEAAAVVAAPAGEQQEEGDAQAADGTPHGDDDGTAAAGHQGDAHGESEARPSLRALRRTPGLEQQEMPFAIVAGRSVTELPKDLYIPPDALEVFLEAFEGPLDLLLYLIRRQNLDILDIRVAEITHQYMQYIELMEALSFELAAEYLVMAAMLAEIKSRMLLPRPAGDEDGEEEDPRAELIRRLQEYERFKKAAEELDELPRVDRDIHPGSAVPPPVDHQQPMPDVALKDLLLALSDVMQRAEMFAAHAVSFERLSTRERMGEVLRRVSEARDFVEFRSLFTPEEGRLGVVVTFIAIMELAKESLVEIVQNEPFAPIHVRARAHG